MTDTRIQVVRGFATTSGTVQTITVSGGFGSAPGSTPVGAKVVIGGLADGVEIAPLQFSHGLTDFTNSRSQSFVSAGAVIGVEHVWSRWSSNDVGAVISTAGNVLFTVQAAAIANGIQLTWSGVPTAAWRLTITLIGGVDPRVAVGSIASFAAGGTSTVTGLTFAPDAIEFGGANTVAFTASPSPTKTGRIGIGWATRPAGIINAGAAWGETEGVTPTDCYGTVSGAFCAFTLSTTGTQAKVGVNLFTSDGFRLVEVAGRAAPALMYMAMRLPGLNIACGVDQTPVNAGLVQHAGGGFQAQCVQTADTLFTATDTFTNNAAGADIGLGSAAIFNSLIGSSCQAIREQDNRAVPYIVGVTGALAAVHIRAVGALNGVTALLATFGTFNATNFTRTYSVTNSGIQTWFAWFTIGANPPPVLRTAVTQDAIVALYSTSTPAALVTQDAIVSLYSGTPATQVTQDAVVVLWDSDVVNQPRTAVTQDALVVLWNASPVQAVIVTGLTPDGLIGRAHAEEGQVSSAHGTLGQVQRGHAEQGQIDQG